MVTLREARTNRLLSMRELARQASVAASTVYLIEAGKTTPRPSIVRRLASVLGVEAREIDEFRRAIEASQQPARSRRQSKTPPGPEDRSQEHAP